MKPTKNAKRPSALVATQPHAMLSAGIRATFDRGVARWAADAALNPLLPVAADSAPREPRPLLAEVAASEFIARAELHEEVFGPAALVVRTASTDEVVAVLQAVGDSLTDTLWGAGDDTTDNRRLVRAAARVAGRVLLSGAPTGVAVTAAQQYGGPYPASTQPFTTSVGYAAVDRFLRPVALQDAPAWLIARKGQAC